MVTGISQNPNVFQPHPMLNAEKMGQATSNLKNITEKVQGTPSIRDVASAAIQSVAEERAGINTNAPMDEPDRSPIKERGSVIDILA